MPNCRVQASMNYRTASYIASFPHTLLGSISHTHPAIILCLCVHELSVQVFRDTLRDSSLIFGVSRASCIAMSVMGQNFACQAWQAAPTQSMSRVDRCQRRQRGCAAVDSVPSRYLIGVFGSIGLCCRTTHAALQPLQYRRLIDQVLARSPSPTPTSSRLSTVRARNL